MARSQSSAPSPATPSSGVPASSGRLPVAIFGAGAMARNHAQAVSRAGGRVVAVADRDPAAIEAFLAVAPGAAVFEEAGQLLKASRPAVVHVCTPPETHVDLAGQAIGAGCSVYVEKPFATTRQGAESLLQHAAERGVQLCAGHQLLFEPPARALFDALPSLGEIHHVESWFSFRPVKTGRGGRAPLRPDEQLLDVLPHPVYLLLAALEGAVPQAESRLTGIEAGPGGTVRGLVRRGELVGVLAVTLEGRPVENFLRVVGSNGSAEADFVRGTVQTLTGPGASTIDKVLQPFRLSAQMSFGAARALGGRLIRGERSYPGLAEIFEAFYRSVRDGSEPPLSRRHLLDTVSVCERVASELERRYTAPAAASAVPAADVVVTGGTGLLGRATVEALRDAGRTPRVIARREPAPWERLENVAYAAWDLARPLPPELLAGARQVLHCAAATAGGFEEHELYSVAATENVLRAAAEAGIANVIHVSSVAVVDEEGASGPIDENTPLEPEPRERGAYVWGKAESERRARRLAQELGLRLRVVRPGAIVDRARFDPPGRLGRRIGNLFVAIGAPTERLGLVELADAAGILTWLVEHPEAEDETVHLLSPTLPSRGELVDLLRRSNSGLRVIWLPRPVLGVLSRLAALAQRLLRPKQEPVLLHKVFSGIPYDTTRIRALSERITRDARRPRAPGS